MNDLLSDSMLKDVLAEQQHISVCFRVFGVCDKSRKSLTKLKNRKNVM